MNIRGVKKIQNLILPVIALWLVGGCEKEKAPCSETDEILAISETGPSKLVIGAENRPETVVKHVLVDAPQRGSSDFQELVPLIRQPEEMEVICKYAEIPPSLDGVADDPVWLQLTETETLDYSSQRPITLKTYHDSENIYFLAKYPDRSASTEHKTLVWNDKEQVYIEGMDREDVLVLKWSMTGGNMSYNRNLIEPHTADIWFWKACRSNPAGYLDDKYNIVSTEKTKESLVLISDKYDNLYLQRKGDEGLSSYSEEMFFEYLGPAVRKFYPREPQGSRADIKGKGNWSDGFWTIEISRKLDTGNTDDVVIGVGGSYIFGVSLYEMAATEVENSLSQPLYHTGNVFDKLTLVVEP